MSKLEEILEELDKGEYNHFTDKNLLSLELMRDFKASHTVARYIAVMHVHNLSKKCYNCKHEKDDYCWKHDSDCRHFGNQCGKWEKKERPRIMGQNSSS